MGLGENGQYQIRPWKSKILSHLVNIEFKNGEMSVTGSGTIRAHVTDELDANVTGSGRIYYKGNPVIDAEVTGSGKVKKEM